MNHRFSLRARFVAAALVCLLPLIAVVGFVLYQAVDQSRDQVVAADLAISNVTAAGISETLSEQEAVLNELSRLDPIRLLSAEGAGIELGRFRQARPNSSGFFLIDANQNIIASIGVDPGPIIPQFVENLATTLATGEVTVSGRILVTDGDVAVVTMLHPVWAEPDRTGTESKPVGVVGSLISIDRLQRTFLAVSSFDGASTSITIADLNAHVVAQGGAGSSDNSSEDIRAFSGPISAAAGGEAQTVVQSDSVLGKRIAIIAPIPYPAAHWAVIVSNPAPLTTGLSNDLIRQGLIALGVAIVLTIGIVLLFGDRIAKPLRRLTIQAIAVARGEHAGTFEPEGGREVTRLTIAVEEMANQLTNQVHDLEIARAELADQAERLRELLRRTVRLQEDERRRIASDIHDAVSPLITGALYQTRALKLTSANNGNGNGNGHGHANGPDDPDQAEFAAIVMKTEEELDSVSALLERAMGELHDVIFALRPPDLDDLGVVPAIDRYVQQINRTGLPTLLEVVGEPQRLSPEARLGIYRIVQESLHNALRHANADEALVRLEWLDDILRVTIHDNGSGFDLDQAGRSMSLGLLSMQERSAAIGANFEIMSRPGAGTSIILELPVNQDALGY